MLTVSSLTRLTLTGVLGLTLSAPALAFRGGASGFGGFGGGLGGSGGGHSAAAGGRGGAVGGGHGGRSGGHNSSGPRGDHDNGGRRGGGRHHLPGGGFPYWWYGGYGGFYGVGGFGYASPFYDPFYDGWYGRGNAYGDDPKSHGDTVTLNVRPENTSVYVNGMLYSSRGRGHFNLPAGDWKIELRAPGYLPQTLDLHVEQGIRYTIERKLERDRSAPSGKQRKVRDFSDEL